MHTNSIFLDIFSIKKKPNICVLFWMGAIKCIYEFLSKEMWNKAHFGVVGEENRRVGGAFLTIKHFKIAYNTLKCGY